MNNENNNDEMNRSIRNENLYRDFYLNNTLVDINKIMAPNEEKEEENILINDDIPVKEFHYEEKNYDLNEFLARKKENRVDDNLTRSLGDSIKDSETTISKIISEIEEKDASEDLFANLMPDDEDTIVTEKVKEAEIDNFVNETTKEEKLDNFISETAINNFIMNKDLNETNSFMEIDDEEKANDETKAKPKVKKSAVVLFILSILMLIGVIIYISIK